jgi:phosphotransferase system HPr-like phosphotransfer protein
MSNEIKLMLSDIDSVKKFNAKAGHIDCDMDLVKGRYVIDAKSLMGIFSLDLSKPITLQIHTDNEKLLAEAREAFAEFEVN